MFERSGIARTRWVAAPLATAMALSLAIGSGGGVAAQSAAPSPVCAPVEATGPLPDLAAQLGHKPKVGLVMKSLANEFFKQMQAGAEAYAAENVDVFDFTAVGMKDERDFAAQVDAVENFVTQQYDVIVIAPADSKAMVAPIKKALDAGIKVINIDVALDAAGHGRCRHRPRVLRSGQPRPAPSSPVTHSPRSSARAARSSSSRATPRPTTPTSARPASTTPWPPVA